MPVFSESPIKRESTAITNTVTPPPNSGSFASQQQMTDPKETPNPVAMDGCSLELAAAVTTTKPSKAQLEIHRKWQAAAEAAAARGRVKLFI